MDCSLPGCEEPLSAWNLPGKSPGVVAISFSRESSQPRDRTRVSHTAGRRFTVWATRKTHLLDTLNKITLFPRALYTWICVDNNNNSKHYVASFIGHFSKCLHNSSFNTYNNNMSWVLFYSPVYSKENEVPRNKICWKTPIGSELKSDTKKSGSRTHVLITVWYLSTFSLIKKYERSLIFWWGTDDFQ